MKLHSSHNKNKSGSAVLVVLALLSLMTAMVAANAKALHLLKREIQLIEREQQKKFNKPAEKPEHADGQDSRH